MHRFTGLAGVPRCRFRLDHARSCRGTAPCVAPNVKRLRVSDGGGRLQEVPDAAGEVALEAADGFAGGLAFGLFAGAVVARLGVAAGAGDGDAVNGRVDLAVAAAIEAVAVDLARADRDRCKAYGARELGVALEAAGAGDHDALAARDQEPLKGARNMPAVLKRPDSLAGQAP